jgi:acetyl esterase/lipase
MRTWVPIRLAVIGLSVLAAACSPLVGVNLLVPEDGYTLRSGLAYGPAERNKLDIYIPREAAASGTVVVFFYGGAWRDGARQDYTFAGQAFSARGYVTVVPDYRLFPEVRFPDFVEDAAAAVAWVRREIAAYGGDPERIVLVGHSAGAHSAAILGLDRRYLERQGVPETAIRGVIGLAGPYIFDPTEYPSTKEIFEGVGPVDDTRPVTFARGDAPSMLLLHGLDDITVLPKNSEELAAALRAEGAKVRYVALPDIGHAGVLLALSSPFEGLAPVMPEIQAFIESLPPTD